jgi:hypothetical protein
MDILNQRLFLLAYSLIWLSRILSGIFSWVGAVTLAEESTPSLYKRNREP